jgi:lipoprotein-releasing system permease protein
MRLKPILTFSWRYFKAKKSTNAINVISWVSVSAIIVGTASLLIILSAFNGFEDLVKTLYASYYSDLKGSPTKGKILVIDPAKLKKLQAIPGISIISTGVEEKALLQNGSLQTIVNIRGVDSNYIHLSGVGEKMYHGQFDLGSNEKSGVVLGVGVEQALGLLADRAVYPVSIYIPRKGQTASSDPLSALGMGVIYPTGSFAIQSEFDNKYAFTNIEFLKVYLNYGSDDYSAVEFKLALGSNIQNVKNQIKQVLGDGVILEDRYEQNRTLYKTIKMEKLAIYGIFTLILLVAAFNMVGSLSMLVLEKRKDIHVLMSMGADTSVIKKIFLAEGVLLGAIGTLGGVALALFLYYVQVTYKLVPLQGASFLIDYYPVKIVYSDFILVTTTVFCIAIGASWIPASKASKEVFELRN